jgi:glycosyltransferase involved in cell wall biosynthesis
LNSKPVILTFIGNYLPGYKAGGILRITVNTVDHLCDEFEFKIVTKDRDLKSEKPYPDIKINEWQQIGNADVFYLSPKTSTLKNIWSLIENTPHQVIYLNSFFEPLTIKVLLIRKLRKSSFKPVIVVPFGEFGWASLKQKYLKKVLFIQIARFFGLYNNVTWRASSKFEAQDIVKVMKIKSDAIHIVGDLPIKNVSVATPDSTLQYSLDGKGLRIIFLSRISREKNLDYALRVLSRVKVKVVFDIYGPAENVTYWKECQGLIGRLPANVIARYLGIVDANQVVNVFSRYDLFLLPTGGEAYGHVIAECLISGTPVLISTETPWRNLEADGLGWDVDLAKMDSFVKIIEDFALLSRGDCFKKRAEIKTKIMKRLLDPFVLESNRQLFKMQIPGEQT